MMGPRSGLIVLAGWLACAPLAYAQSQSWDKQLPAVKRFIVLEAFAGEAVLDKETGLVWERTPGDLNRDGVLTNDDKRSWFGAHIGCRGRQVGNRKGWRVPTVQELSSLIDPSVSAVFPNPGLPSGHPFSLEPLITPAFWSANSSATDPTYAYEVFMGDGSISLHAKGSSDGLIWCVRGGSGIDPQ